MICCFKTYLSGRQGGDQEPRPEVPPCPSSEFSKEFKTLRKKPSAESAGHDVRIFKGSKWGFAPLSFTPSFLPSTTMPGALSIRSAPGSVLGTVVTGRRKLQDGCCSHAQRERYSFQGRRNHVCGGWQGASRAMENKV